MFGGRLVDQCIRNNVDNQKTVFGISFEKVTIWVFLEAKCSFENAIQNAALIVNSSVCSCVCVVSMNSFCMFKSETKTN